MNFTLFSDQPTDDYPRRDRRRRDHGAWLTATAHHFNKRKTNRNTLKTERAGSTRATSTPAISVSPPGGNTYTAWDTVLALGERHGMHINNGGMMSE